MKKSGQAFPGSFLEKYAKENNWHLGGWHPDGEMIIGHFHRSNGAYRLTTEFIAFDKSGNLLKGADTMPKARDQ